MADEEIGARLKLKGRREFSDDANRAAKDVKNIGDETDKADRKMRTMGGSSGGTGILRSGLSGLMGVAKLGALAIASVGAAAGVAGVKFVNLAMNAAESASAFATVFGPATAEVQSFVDTLNQDYGIPTALLQDSARQFGVFAKAAGIPQEGLADFSTALTQAGLDMSSFYNADQGEVFQALQSGLSGETEPLRKFGIFMSDASLNAFALAQGIGKTTSEMTDQEKVALRQKFILANLGDAQGDLARTSGGLANQWRGLKGRLTEAGTAIGTAFLPVVTQLVSSLNDKMGPAVDYVTGKAELFASRVGPAAQFVAEQWKLLSGVFKDGGVAGVASELDSMLGTGSLLTDTVGALQSIFSSLGEIWKGLILPVLTEFNAAIPRGIRPIELLATTLEWVAENGETLQPILAGLLGGFIAFKVVSGILRTIAAAQTLLNIAMSMNPIGAVVIAIAALAAGLIYAWRNSERFREIVTTGFNLVKDTVMGVWNWISDNWPLLLAILTGPIGLAVLFIVEKWDGIVSFIKGLPGRITEAAYGMFDGIKDAFKSVLNWIIRAWNGLDFTIPGFDPPGPGPKFGGFTLGVPDIPELHTGGTTTSAGIVNMRPDEELIFLPPSASVVPMSDNVNSMAAAFSGSSGPQNPIVMQVVLDRKVIAEAVYDHTSDLVARR